MSIQEVVHQSGWNPVTELPPDDTQVLAELKSKKKKRIFAVVEYLRTRPGVHEAPPAWWEPIGDDEVEVVRWRYLDKPVTAASKQAQRAPKDPPPEKSVEELGAQYRTLLESHRAGCHVNFVTGDIWRSDDKDIPKVLTAAEVAVLTLNADRYQKLRRWMSSNVAEGWQQVENLGALAVYMGWDVMDQELDALPECTVGLCAPPAVSGTTVPKADS